MSSAELTRAGERVGAIVPPQNLEAEESVLGAMLLSPTAVGTVSEILSAADFYRELFGWRVERIDTGCGPSYWSIRHEGAAGNGLNGGARLLAPDQAGVPPHWLPYFTVADLDGALATATDAGGMVLAGPIQLPTGSRLAVLADPHDAAFAIFQGEIDD